MINRITGDGITNWFIYLVVNDNSHRCNRNFKFSLCFADHFHTGNISHISYCYMKTVCHRTVLSTAVTIYVDNVKRAEFINWHQYSHSPIHTNVCQFSSLLYEIFGKHTDSCCHFSYPSLHLFYHFSPHPLLIIGALTLPLHFGPSS